MLKKAVVLSGVMLVAGMVQAEVKPLWDLAKDQIQANLRSGKIEKKDGLVILKDGAAFAVPASAFPDQKNFTVEVVASLQELIDHAEFTIMKKQEKDDNGFTFGMNYRVKPWYARHISSVVNNVFMYSRGIGGNRDPKLNHKYKFIVSAINGLVSFYVDDYPVTKCFMEMVPNNYPMWVGKNLSPDLESMPVTIYSVKVFGPDFKYVGKESESKNPRGVVAGKGWALDVPKMEHKDWPKVLIYGDSISIGYSRYFIPEMLKNKVYVYHCCHFVGETVPKKIIEEMAGRYKFDAIIFNNGLHSLHWTPDKVSDQEVYTRMQNLAECFKKAAPQAKMFYLMTTPYTAERPGNGKLVEALGDKNKTVIRLNDISRKVMEKENIPIIDVYTPLTQKLNWAAGDGDHWTDPAYKLIASDIEKRLEKVFTAK